MKIIFPFLAAFSLVAHGSQEPAVSSGKIERLANFPSVNVAPRNVDVWLPESYDHSERSWSDRLNIPLGFLLGSGLH